MQREFPRARPPCVCYELHVAYANKETFGSGGCLDSYKHRLQEKWKTVIGGLRHRWRCVDQEEETGNRLDGILSQWNTGAWKYWASLGRIGIGLVRLSAI
jgi:hypothetical protein